MAGAAEAVLRRQRGVTFAGLMVLVVLAWAWIASGAGMGMAARAELALFPYRSADMPMAMAWDPARLLLTLSMWWVMMVAMMVPAAAPVVLLYARAAPRPHSLAFLAGYLLCWLAFSIGAVALQVALEGVDRLAPMQMALSSRWLAGGLLIAAGLYQFSPLKGTCLTHCRNPAQWLSSHYRPGAIGALRMGLAHGAFCVGCCWLLMLLLFVVGVMNLVWIAALTLVVAAEKLLPRGPILARVGGALFILWGAAILALG